MADETGRVHGGDVPTQGVPPGGLAGPVQIWVPDVRAPEFVAQAHRQSAAVAASVADRAEQEFVDAISIGWDAEPEARG